MSYPPYNAAPYPPQGGAPSYPSYPGQPPYQAGYQPSSSPYPPQGPPAPGAPPPQGYQASYGQPQQPSYGGYPGQPHSGYQQPPAAGGYTPNYAPAYNSGYQPPRSPQPPTALSPQGYPGQPGPQPPTGHSPGYPGQSGYGSPYPAHTPAAPGYGQQAPVHGYGQAPVPGYAPAGGAFPPQQAAPVSQTPVRFQFRQDNGFDSSGTITDENNQTLYKLKDASDKHTWSKYLKSRPLNILRGDGSKVASFDWKDGPSEAKLEAYAVWSRGEKVKLRVEGDILDQDWKFKLPNGRAYEWEGPGDDQIFNLLDHQQVTGEGFDAEAKSIARYEMHSDNRDATLDILPEALAVPDLLDAAVITSFYLEFYMFMESQEAQ
ncbi:unnamed protein product [Somion occarium]|uniref:DUF6593 domain-containing protein n=1 Tax=Somion occarium TaxID=3059160 RepID=A0ABP1D4T3_9APHY